MSTPPKLAPRVLAPSAGARANKPQWQAAVNGTRLSRRRAALESGETDVKKIFVMLLVAGIASLAGSLLAAGVGNDEAGLVKIPFRFIVGEKALPAGTYVIWSKSNDWEMMLISTAERPTMPVALVRTRPVPNPEPHRHGVYVQFESYLGQCFLHWVQMPLSDIHEVKLSRSQAERTLTRLNLMPTEGERAECER